MLEWIIAVAIAFIVIALLVWAFSEFSKHEAAKQNKFYYIGSYDTDDLHYYKKRMRGNIPKWVRDWIYDLNYQEGRHDYRKPNYNPSRGWGEWAKHSTQDDPNTAYLHGRHYSYKLRSDDVRKMLYIYKKKRDA
jgi:hypothetical protein